MQALADFIMSVPVHSRLYHNRNNNITVHKYGLIQVYMHESHHNAKAFAYNMYVRTYNLVQLDCDSEC